MFLYLLTFSAAKAAQGMQMSVRLSVCLSVRPSVTLIFLSDLLVYFIIANRTEMKLKQSFNKPRQNYVNLRILELKAFAAPCTLVLVRFKTPKILAGYYAVNVMSGTDYIFTRLVGLDKYVL